MLIITKFMIIAIVASETFKFSSNYKKGYMFTISNSVNGDAPWKEEAITGLKNVAKQKG
jgi:hypothetical protein